MGLTLTHTLAHKLTNTAYTQPTHGEQIQLRQESKCDRPAQQVVKICYGKKVTTRNSGRSEAIQRSLKEQKH